MKKRKIWSMIMLLLVMSQTTFGQEVNNESKKYPVYCVVSSKAASKSLSDFRLWAVVGINEMLAHYICNEENEQIYFQTQVDILNYMSKQGWSYIEKTSNAGASEYLFMKEAASPEEAYKSLNPLTEDQIKKAKKEKK